MAASDRLLPYSGRRVAVIGASLGGLSAANVLHMLGFTVHVFERSTTTFEARGHGLGYVDVDLWQRLRGVQMRRQGQQASRAQGAFYYGDLWRFLYDGLPRGTVRLGRTITGLGDDPVAHPTIDGQAYDLAVIADGGWSGLRRYLTAGKPFYSGYVVWRGSINPAYVPGFHSFGVFKAPPHLDTIVLPMSTDDGRSSIMLGLFVATPEAEIVRPQTGAGRHTTDPEKKGEWARSHADSVPEWFLPLYQQKFSHAAGGELVRLAKAIIAKGEIRPYPQFDFGTDAVTAGKIVMIGDAAHMASPRTAVGAHTAILDAMGLRKAFTAAAVVGGKVISEDAIDAALARYSRDGTRRAQELHRRSVEIGKQFVPRRGAIMSPASLVSLTRNSGQQQEDL